MRCRGGRSDSIAEGEYESLIDAYKNFKEFPIALGLGCRVNCAYCPVHSIHVPAYNALGGATLMTPDLLRFYLRTVPRDSILVWSGFSEPFLNPHFPQIIRDYHAEGWKMRLDTTLAGCSLESARLVSEIPWTFIKIHLPSHGDKMRVAVTPQYLEILRTVVATASFKCFVYFGIPYPEVKAITDSVPADYYTTLHTRAGNLKPSPVRHSGKVRECLWLRRGHLLPNGKLCLCCEDWGIQHVLGDLNTQTYAEIFKSPPFLDLLAAHEDDTKPLLCRSCESGYYPD